MAFLAGRIGLLVVLLLAAMASHLAAQDGPPLALRLSQTVPERMARDGVPGAVIALIEGGAPVWTGAFGMAAPATAAPMTAGALFPVESISKPVTAWGAMRLAEAGRLNLDEPIDACPGRWHNLEKHLDRAERRLDLDTGEVLDTPEGEVVLLGLLDEFVWPAPKGWPGLGGQDHAGCA